MEWYEKVRFILNAFKRKKKRKKNECNTEKERMEWYEKVRFILNAFKRKKKRKKNECNTEKERKQNAWGKGKIKEQSNISFIFGQLANNILTRLFTVKVIVLWDEIGDPNSNTR